MTDDTDFEEQLRASLSEAAPDLRIDSAKVIRQGRRIRLRRRLTIGGGLLVAAVLVAVPLTIPRQHTVSTTKPKPTASQPALAPTSCLADAPRRSAPGKAVITDPFNIAGDSDPAKPTGDVICTGDFTNRGEIVFWFEKLTGENRQAGSTFTVVEGRRDSDTGALIVVARKSWSPEFNQNGITERTAGFRTVGADGTNLYFFGYYSGPIATLTLTVGSKRIPGRAAKWSADPNISAVWFPTGADIELEMDETSRLNAWDSRHRPIPGGSIMLGGA